MGSRTVGTRRDSDHHWPVYETRLVGWYPTLDDAHIAASGPTEADPPTSDPHRSQPIVSEPPTLLGPETTQP